MKKLLIVDDEKTIRDQVKTYFEAQGYQVLCAESAAEAKERLAQAPDIVLLDVMMSRVDGIQFCRQVRDTLLCPILFLSARTEEASRIQGLSAGGDDYITKPFSMRELYARVEAHLRRESRPRQTAARVAYGSLWIDYGRREVGGESGGLELTKKEFGILELLSLNAGQVFTQDRIYEKIWGYDAQGDAYTAVTEHIKRIRRKLAGAGDGLIETVWGIGYRWKK